MRNRKVQVLTIVLFIVCVNRGYYSKGTDSKCSLYESAVKCLEKEFFYPKQLHQIGRTNLEKMVACDNIDVSMACAVVLPYFPKTSRLIKEIRPMWCTFSKHNTTKIQAREGWPYSRKTFMTWFRNNRSCLDILINQFTNHPDLCGINILGENVRLESWRDHDDRGVFFYLSYFLVEVGYSPDGNEKLVLGYDGSFHLLENLADRSNDGQVDVFWGCCRKCDKAKIKITHHSTTFLLKFDGSIIWDDGKE